MNDQFEVWNVSCPANTLDTAPVEVATVGVDTFDVYFCTVLIPDGHAGLTGIALAFGHTAVVPRNPGGFMSGNDEQIPIPLAEYPTGVPWSVLLYNLDIITHVWQTRWYLKNPITVQTLTAPVTIAPAAIMVGA